MVRPGRRVAVVTALALVGLAARPGFLAAAAEPDAGSLDWHACGGGRECATATVPASYDDPSGPQLTLGIARIPARDAERRMGSLVVNPGGPGLSAVDALGGVAASLPDAVADRFDVVAVDARGTGGSAPVDCGVPLDPVFDRSFRPATADQQAALVAALQGVADACEAGDPVRLRQVATIDSARDLDVVRERLGDERLSYVGFSYGTYLGALYAASFPDRVRAMVLDGAVDPTTDARAATLEQARGFEAGLDRFFRWCENHRDCAFASDQEPAAAYDALRARVAERPLDVDTSASGDDDATDRRVLNDTRFDAAVLAHLYEGRAAWPALAGRLAAAARGDGAPLLVDADRFLGREPGGGDDGTVEAFWAVGCLDDPSAGAPDLQAAAEAVAPRLGAFVANFGLACAVWPTRGTPAAVPRVDGAAPDALVVGTSGDPATPIAGAERLARVLGDAPLVVASGTRHTATGSGNACVDRSVTRALLSPRAPVPERRDC